MADDLVKMILEVLGTTIIAVFVLVIIALIASFAAAPGPGDPFYDPFVTITKTGPRAIALLGLASLIAIVGWIAGQAMNW